MTRSTVFATAGGVLKDILYVVGWTFLLTLCWALLATWRDYAVWRVFAQAYPKLAAADGFPAIATFMSHIFPALLIISIALAVVCVLNVVFGARPQTLTGEPTSNREQHFRRIIGIDLGVIFIVSLIVIMLVLFGTSGHYLADLYGQIDGPRVSFAIFMMSAATLAVWMFFITVLALSVGLVHARATAPAVEPPPSVY